MSSFQVEQNIANSSDNSEVFEIPIFQCLNQRPHTSATSARRCQQPGLQAVRFFHQSQSIWTQHPLFIRKSTGVGDQEIIIFVSRSSDPFPHLIHLHQNNLSSYQGPRSFDQPCPWPQDFSVKVFGSILDGYRLLQSGMFSTTSTPKYHPDSISFQKR